MQKQVRHPPRHDENHKHARGDEGEEKGGERDPGQTSDWETGRSGGREFGRHRHRIVRDSGRDRLYAPLDISARVARRTAMSIGLIR